MADKYTCMRCKCAGAKSLVPYKIIEDRSGDTIKFRGQLCERCFKELFNPPQKIEESKDEEKTNEPVQK